MKDLRIILGRFKREVQGNAKLESVGADFIALHLPPAPLIKRIAKVAVDEKYYEGAHKYYDVGIAILGKIQKL